MARHLLKLWQINSDRARVVTDQIRTEAQKHNVDILLMQEPYGYQGNKITGFSCKHQVITGNARGEYPWTGIINLNPNIECLKLTHLCTPHVTCARIATVIGEFTLVSAYLQPREPPDQVINTLREIGRTQTKIVVCMDANGKSPLWGTQVTDYNGSLIEELTAEQDWYVLNGNNQVPTFQSCHGTSLIDISIISNDMIGHDIDWRVKPDIGTSSHNVLETIISAAANNPIRTTRKYNFKHADWPKFQTKLAERLEPLQTPLTTTPQLISRVEQVTSALAYAARKSIPATLPRTKPVAWWNDELDNLRRATNAKRRKFQKSTTRNPQNRGRLYAEYSQSRREYKQAIYLAKVESWQNFVSEQSALNSWGLAYKLQTNKLHSRPVISSLRAPDGTIADTWNAVATTMTETLIPDDSIDDDTLHHEILRRAARRPFENGHLTDPFDIVDLHIALDRCKNRKAPGIDEIHPEFVKKGGPVLHEHLLLIYNACLSLGKFPNSWKRGLLITILKNPNKDPTLAKSYRPICLLPVMGKVFEQLLLFKINQLLEDSYSPRQFGFRPGKSTEDAASLLRQRVETSNSKYVLAIFIDIEGAFDNVWWPHALERLRRINCPQDAYAVIRDYFRARQITLRDRLHTHTKAVTKGCPQGSVLGPKLWNLVFDEALRRIDQTDDAEVIAYADDAALIVEGESRAQLEAKSNRALNILDLWSKDAKLKISGTKTQTMLLKGKLTTHPPRVRMGHSRLPYTREVRYLGITLQEGYKVTAHVQKIAATANNLTQALARLSGHEWGYRFTNYRILYNAVFVPIVTYAANAWAPKINAHHIRKLRSAQRSSLLRATKAYATTSHNALHVIAGVLPVELLLQERSLRYKIRRQIPIHLDNLQLEQNEFETFDKHQLYKQLFNALTCIWQQNWTESPQGKITRDFFPNVQSRLKMIWIKPDHYVTQILTGHGNFAANLIRFNLAEDDLCACEDSEQDTMYHMLYTCPRYTDARLLLHEAARNANEVWAPDLKFWTLKNSFPALKAFAKQALLEKQDEDGN